MKKILVLGANSAIAQAVCRLWVEQGHALYLIGRNPQKLETLVTDLKVRGARKLAHQSADLSDISQHATLLHDALSFLGGLDIAFFAYGELGEQKKAERDSKELFRIIDSNFTS